MGKGDKKTKRGKIFRGSYGNKRIKKKSKRDKRYISLKKLKKWSIEWLYYYVGQYDFTVSIVFQKGSESFKKFGNSITGEFYYTKPQRQSLKVKINSGIKSETYGKVLFKVILKNGKSNEQIKELLKSGFKNTDIAMLDYYAYKHNETYFNKKQKKLSRPITIEIEENDSYLDTIKMQYSFSKMRIAKGDSLIEFEKLQFMAIQEVLGIEEKDDIYNFQKVVNERKVEYDFLVDKIKFYLSEIDTLSQEVISEKTKLIKSIVDKEFEKSGINPSKPMEIAPYLGIYSKLLEIGMLYEDKIVLYATTPKVVLNFEKFLHVAFRHSPVLRIGPLNENKSRVPYEFSEIERLINNVLQSVEGDINEHFKKHPEKRFSKFKDELIRFNGNYFEVHINTDGLIETFYNHD